MRSTIMNRAFLEANVAKISIWGFALVAWVFILEYSLYLVGADFPDKLIKLGAFASMLVFLRFQRNEMGVDEKKLLVLFSALLLTGLAAAMIVLDSVGILQWLKFTLMSMILVIILVRTQAVRGQGGLLISLYLGLAVIFSLQAILAFFAVLLFGGLNSSVVVDIGRLSSHQEVSLGLLGFANAVQTPIEGVKVLRAQGWFIEPSILAAFLLYPAFASLGRYRQIGNVVFLAFAIIIFAAIFVTFSLAGYFAVLAAVLFLILSKPLHTRLQQHGLLKYGYPFLILILFLVLSKGILFGAQKVNEVNLNEIQKLREAGRYGDRSIDKNTLSEKITIASTKMFARNPQGQSGNLFREKYKAATYAAILLSHPFGIGFGPTLGTNEVNSANALVFWAISGGIPAVALALLFFWHIFWAFCHPLLNGENTAYRYVAASFIGHAIQNFSYGNWLAPFFLLHLAIVVMSARELREDSNSIR